MKMSRTLARVAALCLILLSVTLWAPGCSSDPGLPALADGLDAGAASIRKDAELGIRVQEDPNLAMAAGVPAISPALAAERRKILDEHQQLLNRLRDRGGTIPPR